MKNLKNTWLFFLAVIFAFALMFTFVEIPGLVDSVLQKNFGFPGFDQGSDEFNAFKSELFINTLYLRWIGYTCLLLIAGFIVIGFITKKSGWAYAGAFVLFLPVFGQFAFSMFFLAGLGILRIVWFPFMDISFNVLQLGNIIYLPYEILMRAADLFGWNAHLFLSYFFMSLGAFLFVWGVLAWLQARFSGEDIASKAVYKFSRHPQYAGWLIWSYGIMIFSFNINNMKKSWSVSSSLPWLLASMVVIGICLLEEIKMIEKNKQYEFYRQKTPFLLPLPKWIKLLVNAPVKLIFKRESPATKSQAAGIASFYTVVFILLSLIRVDFGTENQQQQILTDIKNPQYQIDSLTTEIRNSPRRYMQAHFNGLKNLGTVSINPLMNMLSDSNPAIREFSAEALGNMQVKTADDKLIQLLNDNNPRVRNAAILSLGQIKSEKAVTHFIKLLENQKAPGMRSFIYRAMGELGSENAFDILAEGSNDSVWFVKNSALNSLCKINSEKAAEIVKKSLRDKDPNVRRNSVYLILMYNIKSLKQSVKILLEDEDFETRFYSKIIMDRL